MARERGGGSAAQPSGPYQPRQPEMVRAIEYDMTDVFESCVTLYAQLTDADPATYPAAGAPFGPELTDFEDGQGGPRGENYSPAEGAIAAALGVQVDAGSPDKLVEVPSLAAETGPDDPPTPSGVLQLFAAEVFMKILYGARMARFDLLRAVSHAASCMT
eukprot:1777089-Pyramimonas_sp.AAC.1